MESTIHWGVGRGKAARVARTGNTSMQELFILDDFDMPKILEALVYIGATSVRILHEDFRTSLLKEAEGYLYKREDEIVGSGDRMVRQQVGSCCNFIDGSKYMLLMTAFQALLDECLAGREAYPFGTHLSFNSMVLQKYEKGSLGITPHRDRLTGLSLSDKYTYANLSARTCGCCNSAIK